jgi:glycosyltransferase involved in cell wall biosynthesis
MVTTFYPPHHFGGDAVYVYRLANALAERGHRVDVVYTPDAHKLLSGGAPASRDYVNHPRVTVHALTSRVGPLSLLLTQQTGRAGLHTSRLKEILNGGAHDVIHFHNISLIGLSALQFGTGIKLYTMLDHWLVCPLHVLWKFDRTPCSRRHCIPCTIHGRRPPQFWRYTGLPGAMLDQVDAFIALSRFSREKHRQMGLAARAPIAVIPLFAPHPAPPDPGEPPVPPHPVPFFLFAGRLEKMKGAQVAIEAFRRYRDCDLLIAGGGRHRPALERLARGLPHVHFRGSLGHRELQVLYRHAVALLVPSVGYETFGMVVAEAFAQRTPAIVHNLGSLPEIIAQSGGGITYDDVAGLRDALEALRGDPLLRNSLGERGYQAYLRYWSPEAHLQQYFAVIDEVMARKGAAGIKQTL